MPKINIVWDATMLDMYQMCGCKYDYKFNKMRVPVVLAKPLDRGQVLHVGEESYWNSLKAGLSWERAIDLGMTHIRVALNKSDLTAQEGSRILDVFEENHHFWREDDLRYPILEVEKPFAYVLYDSEEIRIVMIGKIDLVRQDGNSLQIVDHKGYDRDFPIKRLQNQGANYCNALDTYIIWFNRIGFQTSLKPKDKHKRIPISYDPVYLSQWRDEVIKWSLKYVESVQDNSWERNFTSCDKFNRLCEYYEVCDTSGEENRIYKLETNFKLGEKWDVSKSLAKSSEILK